MLKSLHLSTTDFPNAGGGNLHVLLFPTMKPIDNKNDAE